MNGILRAYEDQEIICIFSIPPPNYLHHQSSPHAHDIIKKKRYCMFSLPAKTRPKLGPKQRESPRDWESGVPLRHVAKRGDKGVGEINGED